MLESSTIQPTARRKQGVSVPAKPQHPPSPVPLFPAQARELARVKHSSGMKLEIFDQRLSDLAGNLDGAGAQALPRMSPRGKGNRNPLASLAGNGTPTPRDSLEAHRSPKQQRRKLKMSPAVASAVADAVAASSEDNDSTVLKGDEKASRSKLSSTPRKSTLRPLTTRAAVDLQAVQVADAAMQPAKAEEYEAIRGEAAIETRGLTPQENGRFHEALEQLASAIGDGGEVGHDEAEIAWEELARAVGGEKSVDDIKVHARTYIQQDDSVERVRSLIGTHESELEEDLEQERRRGEGGDEAEEEEELEDEQEDEEEEYEEVVSRLEAQGNMSQEHSAASPRVRVEQQAKLLSSVQSTALKTGGGAWTPAERRRLAVGLDQLGKAVLDETDMSPEQAVAVWDTLSSMVGTRSPWETRLFAAEWLLKGGGLSEMQPGGIDDDAATGTEQVVAVNQEQGTELTGAATMPPAVSRMRSNIQQAEKQLHQQQQLTQMSVPVAAPALLAPPAAAADESAAMQVQTAAEDERAKVDILIKELVAEHAECEQERREAAAKVIEQAHLISDLVQEHAEAEADRAAAAAQVLAQEELIGEIVEEHAAVEAERRAAVAAIEDAREEEASKARRVAVGVIAQNLAAGAIQWRWRRFRYTRHLQQQLEAAASRTKQVQAAAQAATNVVVEAAAQQVHTAEVAVAHAGAVGATDAAMQTQLAQIVATAMAAQAELSGELSSVQQELGQQLDEQLHAAERHRQEAESWVKATALDGDETTASSLGFAFDGVGIAGDDAAAPESVQAASLLYMYDELDRERRAHEETRIIAEHAETRAAVSH
eukprot:COSAG05_NODE_38_length_27626_cov_78.614306_12_plen_825_part_00